jgi:cell division protein FtsL
LDVCLDLDSIPNEEKRIISKFEMMDWTTIITTLLTCVFGAGAWKFYTYVVKIKAKQRTETMDQHNVYRDDLRKRVEKLENDKDSCIDELSDLKAEVAALRMKIEFLEKK